MKTIVIPLACLAVLLVFIGSASADFQTHVVYQQGEEPCTVGDYYFEYDDLQDNYCIDQACFGPNPPAGCNIATNEGGCHNAIQEAYWNASGTYGDTIVICPGTYRENIYMIGAGATNLTIKSHSQNPNDTIIEAKDPNEYVFYIHAGQFRTISGLTITGATGDGDPVWGCARRHNNDGTPDYLTSGPNTPELPPQPCSGLRFYSNTNGSVVKNNHITGNNHGIIVKDTYWGWSFFTFIEENDIYNNEVGVHLRYGSNSYVINNQIHDNTSDNPNLGYGTGIRLIDTWQNKVVGNSVSNNSTGIELGSYEYWSYPPGEATSDNRIYNNNIYDNVVDDKPMPVPLTHSPLIVYCSDGICQHYWYEPILQVGNYWSDWDGITVPWPAAYFDEYPRLLPYDYSSPDLDGDGFANYADNCPDKYNLDQVDDLPAPDGNGIGDVCDCSDQYKLRNITDMIDDINHYGNFNLAYDYKGTLECRDEHGLVVPCMWDKFQLRAGNLNENITITYNPGDGQTPGDDRRRRYVYFFNGYDCNYTANNGVTTLKGQMTVESGNLVIRNGTLVVAKSN